MTKGVISERDRLLTYTVGEFYQELSLYLEEAAKRKELVDNLKNR
jgi:DNA polymerase sigma